MTRFVKNIWNTANSVQNKVDDNKSRSIIILKTDSV